ncbi:hypothetical protein Tco_1498656, partial [Tanacetum coccineum]
MNSTMTEKAGVKRVAPPCGVKGQHPLWGQGAEPLAGVPPKPNQHAMPEEDAFLVDNVEGGLCVDYTDAGIVRRCNNGSDKDKGKELWDSLESKYMVEDSSSKKILDFKHTLKHGEDDLSLVQLGSHLRIEESLRAQDSDKGKGKEVVGPSVNI